VISKNWRISPKKIEKLVEFKSGKKNPKNYQFFVKKKQNLLKKKEITPFQDI
jgi:hypothetical protein